MVILKKLETLWLSIPSARLENEHSKSFYSLYSLEIIYHWQREQEIPRSECIPNSAILDISEEEVLCKYLLDKDGRGLGLSLAGVEDMANFLLEFRGASRVGTLWAHRFIQRKPELKMRSSRAYDFQRALCEDPDEIKACFRLVENMKAKYGIINCDFYNSDETGFMDRDDYGLQHLLVQLA